MSIYDKIQVRTEKYRRSGKRKAGKLYVVAEKLSAPCYALPVELPACPCCNRDIKVSAGFTWMASDWLTDSKCSKPGCKGCYPFDGNVERFGLLWVRKGYNCPLDFTREAAEQGVSRKIRHVPNDFVLGETWILLGHSKAVPAGHRQYKPGIFHAFKPTALEYIVSGEESKEKLESLIERGFTLVKVVQGVPEPLPIMQARKGSTSENTASEQLELFG